MPKRFLALTVALLLLCGGCGTATRSDHSAPPEVSAPEMSPPDTSAPADTSAPPDASSAAVSAPDELPPSDDGQPPAANAPTEPAVPVSAPVCFPPDYNFATPVPEGQAVEVEYFADAAFVGDSRTEGFWLYSGIKQGTLLSATGLTVFTVDTKIAFNRSQTVMQALSSGTYGKIYLSLGINELGYLDTEAFVEAYCSLIDAVRACQPDAVIYIQNLIPVNDSKARASGHRDHVNCERIRFYNELIARVAQEKQVPLLDLYSAFAVDGQLPADASRDGVHLLPAACRQQLNYLLTHTLSQQESPPDPIEPEPEIDVPAEPTPDPDIPTEPTTEPDTPVTPGPETEPQPDTTTETEAAEL